MKQIQQRLVFLLLFISVQQSSPAIFYTNRWGPRAGLGHNLMNYALAKSLALATSSPFVYQPFPLSHFLKLHEAETPCPNHEQFNKIIGFGYQKTSYPTYKKNNPKTLCIVDYTMRVKKTATPLLHKDSLAKLISPCVPVPHIRIPEGTTTTVAVHVRRNDAVTIKKWKGIKSHSDKEYIAGLQKLLKHLDREKIYVHIFTDDQNPQAIVQKFSQAIGTQSVSFGWNQSESDLCVVADLFNMASFDYLIRPLCSNFSMIAQLIGSHKGIVVLGKPSNAPHLSAPITQYLPSKNRLVLSNKKRIWIT